MECEWKEVPLSNLVKIKHGFAFKGEYFTDEPTSDLLVTPGNFAIGGGFQLNKPKYYSGPVPEDYILKSGDIVVTMTDLSKAADTLGYGAVVPLVDGIRFLHNQRIGLVESVSEDVDLLFISYLMRTQAYRSWVIGSASGSTVKHTSPSRILAYQFLLPTLHEQRSIASTLSSLDERIALLRETNATLEAIAQAIFKSWFVDFDPVKAKAEGREPEGMDAETAALFPSEFEESELGLIPKGWRINTANTIMELGRRTVNPGNAPETLYEHYSLPAFDAGQMPVMEYGGDIKSNKSVVTPESVLLSKLNPHIPRIWLPMVQDPTTAISSTEFLVVIPKGHANREYLYAMFISDDFIGRFQQLVTGTSNSHQRIKPNDLLEMKLVVPPSAMLSAFKDAVSSQFCSIANNRFQSKTLASLRDTLLPRLMSGQLRVPEAEEMVEEMNG